MKRAIIPTAALLILLIAGSASAYVLQGFDWAYLGDNPTVSLKVNANCSDPTAPDELVALMNAMATWTNCAADFNFAYSGTTTIINYTYNGLNEMCWNPGSSGGALATTTMWYQGTNMIESDCVFWDSWAWSTTWPTYTQFDVESVALHELGHTVGLGHSQYSSAVMWPYINNGEVQRVLDQDDLNGIIAIYGIPAAPYLDVTMTPINPPIVVPAQGGSFQFTAAVINWGPGQPFQVWARIKNPDGSYTGPTLGPVTINPPVWTNVSRVRTQSVPSTWPSGQYTYLGYGAVTMTYPALDSSSFTFTKSATADGGPAIWEAVCSGEPFPGEAMAVPAGAGSSQPSSFDLCWVSPNPFNPTTAISYQVSAFSHVNLKVYDMAGRLVSTLVEGWREAGTHKVTFDGSNLASGMYLYALTAGGNTLTGKMALMK
jgi:hypothetical protein